MSNGGIGDTAQFPLKINVKPFSPITSYPHSVKFSNYLSNSSCRLGGRFVLNCGYALMIRRVYSSSPGSGLPLGTLANIFRKSSFFALLALFFK